MKSVDQLYNLLFSEKVLKVLLMICSLVLLATYYNRGIKGDDCWFGEQAYWLVEEGAVKLKSIPMIFNWQNEMLVYHKLLTWMDSLIVMIFGWSVDYMRVFNLLLFILSLFVVRMYLRKEERAFNYLFMFLMLCTPMVIGKSFEIRPEVPAMLFGFSSFYFLHRYREEDRIGYVAIAGGLAAAAFLTHLNGVIFCVSGSLILLFFRNIKGAILFSVVAIPVCFIYFIPLLDPQTFEQWWYNLRHWPLHSFENVSERSFVVNLLKTVAEEQKRYFWSPDIAITSGLLIICFITKGKYLWKHHRFLMMYTLLQIFGLAILGSHKSPRYLMLNFPFIILIITHVLKSYQKTEKRAWLKGAFILILVAQVIVSTAYAVEVIHRNGPWVDKHRQILSHIPEKAKLLGPWELIYNEIDNYEIINYKTFLYLEENMDHKMTQQELLQMAASMQIEYVIINERVTDEHAQWFDSWEVEKNPFYKEMLRDSDYLILERINRGE